MAAEDDAAGEAEQDVLADRLDRLEAPPVEALDEAERRRARVRRLHLDGLAAERLEASCGSVQAVSLWHSRSFRE